MGAGFEEIFIIFILLFYHFSNNNQSTMDAINDDDGIAGNVAAADPLNNAMALFVDGSDDESGDHDNADNDDADADQDDDDDDSSYYTSASNEAKETTTMINDLIVVLQNRNNFPLQQREGKIVELARYFHQELKNDIHAMITDQTYGDNYAGLDANRDTEAEVETALRSYPENITRRKQKKWIYNDPGDIYGHGPGEEREPNGRWVDVNYGDVPIHCLTQMRDENDGACCVNLKAIPFVHLFAKLALELNSSVYDKDVEERGGLLITEREANDDEEDYWSYKGKKMMGVNVFHGLVRESCVSRTWDHTNEQIDHSCLTQLVRLRQSGLLTKQDVLDFRLVPALVSGCYFSELRFRFLTEWNPRSLVVPGRHGRYLSGRWDELIKCLLSSPLVLFSRAVRYRNGSRILFYRNGTILCTIEAIGGFHTVCDSIIRYYPKKKGLVALFRNNGVGPFTSSFALACRRFNREQVVDVIEATLTRYATTVPLNTADALILAAIDKTTHLDGVYFLLRRQPDILSQLRRNKTTDQHDDDGGGNDGGGTDIDGTKNRKRKRGRYNNLTYRHN